MLDLSRRLLIVIIMGFCIACMFLSVKTVKAESNSVHILSETKEWVWPIEEGRISDHFGTRHGRHDGLDVAAPKGTPIYTVDAGTVTKSYYSSSYGNVIFVMHPNGYETVYAHLSKRLVKEGDIVTKGQQIGKVGNTGRSRGAHLHFEVHKGEWNIKKSNAIDPLHTLDVSVFIGEGKEKNVLAEKKQEVKLATLEKIYKEQNVSDLMLTDDSSNQLLASSVVVSNDLQEIDVIEEVEKLIVSSEKVVTLTVEENMTLWQLANQYQVTIESIKIWNQLQSDMIQIGEKLIIYPDLEKVYIVESGDTLEMIESKTGVSINEIKEFNSLENDNLYPNQVLSIVSENQQ
ncbi:M23 family metallopeptidase [Bacillus suaedaesalsae]|uniref:Peptidoglycan DD-metalloendopeptidase family protein n=1 Tax=Bacillus suaedaesalsae TaxID=2810349 RepID=A0ABS2DN70_9BACI|nr:peptidoglycan DD-metalloendopeptidase family protein [Bacillus suaedaesalsae]